MVRRLADTHLQPLRMQRLTVQRQRRLCRVRCAELDEAVSERVSGELVVDDLYLLNGAERCEQRAELVFGYCDGNVVDD